MNSGMMLTQISHKIYQLFAELLGNDRHMDKMAATAKHISVVIHIMILATINKCRYC
jgi:hypothetical protein